MKGKKKNLILIGVSAINSGKRSGKDSFADFAIDFIKQSENKNIIVFKYSFAESLKRICENLGLEFSKLNGTEQEKESLTDWDWPEDNNYNKIGKMTYREVAQYVGSDLFRDNFDKDVWVKVAYNNVLLHSEREYNSLCDSHFPYKDVPFEDNKEVKYVVFLPDVRFPNEVEILDYLVDIDRSNIRNLEKDQHISEQAGKLISDDKITTRINNWQDLDFLKNSAIEFVKDNILQDG